jgi:hypothetical protein
LISKWQVSLISLTLCAAQQAFAHDLVDPMMPQIPKPTMSAATQKAVAVAATPRPNLRLDAVTIIGDYKVAFVNGVRMMLGGVIQGAVIMEIGPNWVALSFQNESFRIEHSVPQAIIVPAAASSEETL